MGVVNIEIQVPQPPKKVKVVGNLKRKVTASNKPSFAGTNSDHYLSFIKKTLDQMYRYPEMKEFYLIMDNSPLHDKKEKNNWVQRLSMRLHSSLFFRT
jgi:hypothetical protein